MVWASTDPSKLTSLIKLQKKAVRKISKASYPDDTAELFKHHKILNIEEIYKVEVYMPLMFKFYHCGLLPEAETIKQTSHPKEAL